MVPLCKDSLLCGWRYKNDIPSESKFSRVFKELSALKIAQKTHEQFVKEYLRDTLFFYNASDATKHPSLKALAKKEEPLMVYYDSLVKTIERLLTYGSSWIPELIVIALLSEWIIEEEKSTYFYPFLKEIDYLDLINRYDNSKIGLDKEKREIILNRLSLHKGTKSDKRFKSSLIL